MGGGGCGNVWQWWLVAMSVGSNKRVGFAMGLREDKYIKKERGRDRLRI